MSPKSDGFRAHARTAENAARIARDPEVKQKLLDIARSWHALAAMVDRGKVVELPEPGETPSDS
jgi:hypothetical protein